MKRVHLLLALSALAVLASGIVPASAQGSKKPAPKLPVTFVCKHCKIKMTVKTAADWNKKCWVCPCKVKAKACK
ncbi:MAG TPA: hypothetical protein VFA07_19560 [Chthonomonadaceae bacterium]|nr:hypothetical protein [Chthonomonadaceae bacterium]